MKVDLDMAGNMLGSLPEGIRARLLRVIGDPSEENWDGAYSIVLNPEEPTTLWVAVIAIDPAFPHRGPVDRWVEDDSVNGGHSERVSGWERVPASEVILQAINYATR